MLSRTDVVGVAYLGVVGTHSMSPHTKVWFVGSLHGSVLVHALKTLNLHSLWMNSAYVSFIVIAGQECSQKMLIQLIKMLTDWGEVTKFLTWLTKNASNAN